MNTNRWAALARSCLGLGLACLTLLGAGFSRAADLPNILWITSEDNGPQLGCYGDTYATTPHIDKLAARGLRYLNAWSTAPVCAPARTTLITGVYPPSTGSQHMRSDVAPPAWLKMFPQYLREAGYHASNNSKEDYNLQKPGKVWDDSSPRAHWRARKPGQPFFAVFNFTETHESQIRKRPHTPVHDPAKVPIPPFHPDTPEVRQDWAQYYDKLTEMDARVGQILQQLAEDGLDGDTVIFYYGDHGPGMPRGKRWLYNTGLRVPLVVVIPEKFRHLAPDDYLPGGATGRLVGFIDFAPTVLNLAGLPIPKFMQGRPFLGPDANARSQYLFGFRDRMDCRYDFSRAVRDAKYQYIRNYRADLPWGQHVSYMFETPTTQVWKKLHDAGKLNPVQDLFWQAKPPEELYDLEADPDEIHNLAADPSHVGTLGRLRSTLRGHLTSTRDLGFLPEMEMHRRADGIPPADLGADRARYPLEEILAMAEAASDPATPRRAEVLAAGLRHRDPAARYWAIQGWLTTPAAAATGAAEKIRPLLADPAPCVQIAAAQFLGLHGQPDDLEPAVETLLRFADCKAANYFEGVAAWNSLDFLDAKATPWKARLAALPTTIPGVSPRCNDYLQRLSKKTLEDLAATP